MLNIDDLQSILVSKKFGILNNVVSFISPICPALHISVSSGKRYSKNHYSYGIDFNKNISRIKCISEGIERYCSVIPRNEKLKRLTPDLIDRPTISMDNFNLFSIQQNQLKRRPEFLANSYSSWLEFVNEHEDKTFLPESAAYLKNSLEADYIPISSNGCAAHFDQTTAQLTALLELIERDAVMCHWRTWTPPKKLVIDQYNWSDIEIISLLQMRPVDNVKIEFFSLPSEFGSCTILVAGFGQNRDWPAFICGCASHPNKEIAFKKALLEFFLASALYFQNHYNRIDFTSKCPLSESAIQNFSDHAYYYYFYENLAIMNKFFQNTESETFETLEVVQKNERENLNILIDRLSQFAYQTYFFDHTTVDVRKLNFQVWRSVVPGLAMIHARHCDLMLNPKRFDHFLKNNSKPQQKNLNELPHFFP